MKSFKSKEIQEINGDIKSLNFQIATACALVLVLIVQLFTQLFNVNIIELEPISAIIGGLVFIFIISRLRSKLMYNKLKKMLFEEIEKL
jgi:hypothetical protein